MTTSHYLEMPWAVHLLVLPGLALLVWGAKRSLRAAAQPSSLPSAAPSVCT